VNTSEPAVPLLNVRRKINYDLLFMLGGGSLALALCVGHFTWNLYLRNDYEYRTTQLSSTEKDIKAARKGINTSRTEMDKLDQKLQLLRNNVTVIPKAIAALQRRPMALLQGLAKHTHPLVGFA
jgi:septal ring factor EnvC (AmiA/AmiB activator)